MKPLIGFIGQGYIGKNYADDFENRGYEVIRYSKNRHADTKSDIAKCDMVFIAVPTPTTPDGFDASIVREVLDLVGKGKTAVIKSTILPGTTEELQEAYPEISVLHSPEFLTEANAKEEAAEPLRNIVGYVRPDDKEKAEEVMKALPNAPYEAVLPARSAELVKYAGNCLLFTKVVYANLLYDLSQKYEVDYEQVKEAMVHDPRLGTTHLDPVHFSGRGAGGSCFIKDFAAFREMYEKQIPVDLEGIELLKSFEKKNNRLLTQSKKDLEILKGVYGDLEKREEK